MKALLTLLILISYFSPTLNVHAQTKKEIINENFYWTCPMHPEVHSDHPGNCPICHMTLIKKFIGKEETQKLDMREASQVEGRKSVKMDQAMFAVSGARPYKVEKKNYTFNIKAYGKILSSTRFFLQIAEVDLPFISVGQTVALKAASMNFSEYKGKITSIDHYLEPMSKTARAEGNIIGTNNSRPESTLVADINIEKNNIIAIPEDAVLHGSATDYVFVFDDKKGLLVPTKITAGLNSNGTVEILSGLTEGTIITRGANFLLDSESRMQFSYDQKNN